MALLNPQEPALSHAEWEALEETCTVLSPFEEVTREMSSERYAHFFVSHAEYLL